MNTESVHIICSTNCILCTVTTPHDGDDDTGESAFSRNINNTVAAAAAADDDDDEIMSTTESHSKENRESPGASESCRKASQPHSKANELYSGADEPYSKACKACWRTDEPYSGNSMPCFIENEFHYSGAGEEPYTSERLTQLRAGYKMLSSPTSAVKFDFNIPRVSDSLSALALKYSTRFLLPYHSSCSALPSLY